MLDLAVAGLAGGGVYALIGVCLVLSYRVGAVINFSQTFTATLAVFVMSEFVDRGWDLWVSIGIAIVLGATISTLQGWIMARWFGEASVLVRSTVTIGMAITIFGLTVRIFHDTLRNFPILFKSVHIELGSVTVTGSVLASIVGAVGFAALLWVVLAKTRLGVILRAVSGRPTTAELMGVRTTRLIVLVWAVAGALTTAAILLVAPSRRTIPSLALLVVPGLAAAIVGAMRSFALTVVGGLLIGTIESVALEWGTIGNYRPALSFVMVTLALLWSQRRETWSDAR